MSIPQASVEANVICTSVSDRKVRFLLEEAALQDAWYPSAWLVGCSLSGEGMGWANQLIMMMMIIDWTGLHFSHREAMVTGIPCNTSKCARCLNPCSAGRMEPPGATQGWLWKASLKWEMMYICAYWNQLLGGVQILIFIGTLVDLLFCVSITPINTHTV